MIGVHQFFLKKSPPICKEGSKNKRNGQVKFFIESWDSGINFFTSDYLMMVMSPESCSLRSSPYNISMRYTYTPGLSRSPLNVPSHPD